MGVTISQSQTGTQSQAGGLDVEFLCIGKPLDIIINSGARRVHTDELWKSTCFEMFFAQSGDAYIELNLSPSGAFAAYHFDHYRTGMKTVDMPPPAIDLAHMGDKLVIAAHLSEDDLPWGAMGQVGISAVIEERSGAKSYWALAHPDGKPDFHHRDCFALTLAPLLDR